MMTKHNEDTRQYDIAQKVFYFLFMLYSAFLVIFHKPENEMIANLSGVFLVAMFLLYQIVYTTKSFYINSMLLIYFIFLLYCILSLTWTIDESYSSYTVIRMLQIFVNLLLLYNILKVFKVHEAVFAGLLIGMLLNTLLALELIDIIEPTYLKVRFIGTTTHPNSIGFLAIFAILSSALLIQTAKNKFWLVLNVVNMLGAFYVIVLAASRSSMVIATLIILLFVVQVLSHPKSRIYFFIFLGILFLLFIYFVDMAKLMEHVNFMMERLSGISGTLGGQHADGSTAERLKFLHIMIEVFKENPFLGTGINTSRVFLNGFYSHNNYIELLGTLGLFGALLYYSSFGHLAMKISRVRDFWTRYYLWVFIAVIMIYDFAGVTFYAKNTLLFLLVLHYQAEEAAKV